MGPPFTAATIAGLARQRGRKNPRKETSLQSRTTGSPGSAEFRYVLPERLGRDLPEFLYQS
jgi:hypothetical protein